MNSQYDIIPPITLNHQLLPPYVHTFYWIFLAATIGLILGGLPKQVVVFCQQPLGMFLIIYTTLLLDRNLKVDAESNLKIFISSIAFTIAIQIIIKVCHLIWKPPQILQQQQQFKNNNVDTTNEINTIEFIN